MDSPFSTPETRLAVIAAQAVEYLTELFYRRVKRACEISSRKLLPGRFQVVPLSAASELFGKKLQAWADERRMDVREPKVRRLLNAGKTLEASQLRSEIFKEMDLASRQIWETIPGSSAERPPWKTVTPGPYMPSKSKRWKPR